MSENSTKSDTILTSPVAKDDKEILTNPLETPTKIPVQDKGKGISTEQPAQDISMDEAESSSEDEVVEGDADVADVDEEDTMEEIDPQNIISGERRTRGRTIDFAKAAEEMGPDEEDEEEDDDDFEAVDEDEIMD